MRVPLPAAMITTSNTVMSFILILRRIIRQALCTVGLLTLCVLSACSTLKLVYNQSDDLLYWWVDAYVDLEGEQKASTREALSELQRWHRQQQLPEYVALLQKARSMALHDITAAEVCMVNEEVKANFVTLLRQIEPAAARLGTQLKTEQLQHMRKRYDKTNKEWRSDWLEGSTEKRLRYRTKQALNRLEDFYGRLDDTQREVLNQWLSGSAFDAARNYAERERRQTDSLQTLQRMSDSGSVSAAQGLLRAWADRAFNSPNESYRSYNQALWQENCTGFAKLHNSTTPAQRQHLVETLRGYETDLKALISQK
jgi:hypothetical protein